MRLRGGREFGQSACVGRRGAALARTEHRVEQRLPRVAHERPQRVEHDAFQLHPSAEPRHEALGEGLSSARSRWLTPAPRPPLPPRSLPPCYAVGASGALLHGLAARGAPRRARATAAAEGAKLLCQWMCRVRALESLATPPSGRSPPLAAPEGGMGVHLTRPRAAPPNPKPWSAAWGAGREKGSATERQT